jgi:hypothetical protein
MGRRGKKRKRRRKVGGPVGTFGRRKDWVGGRKIGPQGVWKEKKEEGKRDREGEFEGSFRT